MRYNRDGRAAASGIAADCCDGDVPRRMNSSTPSRPAAGNSPGGEAEIQCGGASVVLKSACSPLSFLGGRPNSSTGCRVSNGHFDSMIHNYQSLFNGEQLLALDHDEDPVGFGFGIDDFAMDRSSSGSSISDHDRSSSGITI